MTKLEAIIQPTKFGAVKEALLEIGVDRLRGARPRAAKGSRCGREYSVDLRPKVKIEIVLPDRLMEKAIEAVTNTARTGKIGDGKIFLSRVDEAIPFRNDERGENAL